MITELLGFEGKNWDFVTDAGAEQGLGSPALLGPAQAAVSLEVSVCDCHCIPEDFVQKVPSHGLFRVLGGTAGSLILILILLLFYSNSIILPYSYSSYSYSNYSYYYSPILILFFFFILLLFLTYYYFIL